MTLLTMCQITVINDLYYYLEFLFFEVGKQRLSGLPVLIIETVKNNHDSRPFGFRVRSRGMVASPAMRLARVDESDSSASARG